MTMAASSQEVRNFIRDCEVLQALLTKGNILTDEELGVIAFEATDLLRKVKLSKNPPGNDAR